MLHLASPAPSWLRAPSLARAVAALLASCALAVPASAEELAVATREAARPASPAPLVQPRDAPEREMAGRALADVEAQSFQVQAELRRARTVKDPHRAACLTDLLTRLHVAARAGRTHRDSLLAAAARGDTLTVAREAVRLGHLRDRATRLFSGASRCGDREVVIEGTRSTVVRVVAPSLPEGTGYPRARPRPPSD